MTKALLGFYFFLESMTTQTHQPGLSDEKKLKIISFAASALSGFFGVMGALFFNWMMQWWLGRDMKRVNGLALFTVSIFVVTGIAVRILWPVQILHTDWFKAQILLISIAFGMIGALIGNRYEKRLKERHLRQLFIGILIFFSFKLFGFIPVQFFSSGNRIQIKDRLRGVLASSITCVDDKNATHFGATCG